MFVSCEQTNTLPAHDIAPGNMTLEELDAAGFIAAPGENEASFRARADQMRRKCAELAGKPEDGIEMSRIVEFNVGEIEPINRSALDDAAGLTEPLFGFRADWVPAFFPRKGLGLLWGGCTVETEDGVPVFFLRRSFRNRRKWFIYGRAELLAHELCHAVRGCLKDEPYEEHFAYMTSSSAFRRWTGNCFRHDWDAIAFTVPVFLLLIMQLIVFTGVAQFPLWPFWILAFVFPAFLLGRNIPERRTYFRARHKLSGIGFEKTEAALFRMTSPEIRKIASMDEADLKKWVAGNAEKELRWRMITARFQTSKE